MGLLPSFAAKSFSPDCGLCARVVDESGKFIGFQFSEQGGKYQVECFSDKENSEAGSGENFYPFDTDPVSPDKKRAEALPAVCVKDVFAEGCLHIITSFRILHIKTPKADEFAALLRNIHGTFNRGNFYEIWPRMRYMKCTILDYSIIVTMEETKRHDYPNASIELLNAWFNKQGVTGVKISSTVEEKRRGQKETYSILFPIDTKFDVPCGSPTVTMASVVTNTRAVWAAYMNQEGNYPFCMYGLTSDGRILECSKPGAICDIPGVVVPKDVAKRKYIDDVIQNAIKYANFPSIDYAETGIKNCFAECHINRSIPFCYNHHLPLIAETRKVLEDIPLLSTICEEIPPFEHFDSVASTGYKRYRVSAVVGKVDESMPFSDEEINVELKKSLDEALLYHEFSLLKFKYPVNSVRGSLVSKDGEITLTMEVRTK